MSSKKKKRAGKNVNMGDTVKLTKGRIGLIRFIGKCQFGLGEWIGIELYNELIRTRHNGAVLGKRYFRCPAHRGVFVRRSLIKENIAVLDIQPSINKLRSKEKKMKADRKKKLKKEKEAKKLKNVEKRESKRLKMQAKYANSPKYNMVQIQTASPPPKIDKNDNKIESPKKTSKELKSKPVIAKELPASFTSPRKKRNSSSGDAKVKEKDVSKKRDSKIGKKRGKNKRKRNSNSKKSSSGHSNESSKDNTYVYEEERHDSENDDFPPINTNEFVTAEPLIVRKYKLNHDKIGKASKKKQKARERKSKSIENISKKKKRNSIPNKRPVLKTSSSSPGAGISGGHNKDQDGDIEVSVGSVSSEVSKRETPRHSLSSAKSKSIGDGIRNIDEVIMDMERKDNDMPVHGTSMKNKVSMHSYDGVLDSDDSLNVSEDEEEAEDSVLMKELEEDFEKNYEKFHKVLDDYAHTVDDIENERKKLADKLVKERKRRKSKSKRNSGNRNRGGYAGYKEIRDKVVSEHNKRQAIDRKINPNLMIATMRNTKNKKKFDSARSRRGSSFVDDYNLNDTLFFDGAEESDTVKDDDQFYVDTMGSDDEEEDNTMNTIQEEKKEESIIEGTEEDEYSMTETENEVDPLLGTIDDDETEYEEEELKIFDIEKDDSNEKIVIFYVELSEFLEWESSDNGYGMKISKINDNEYGEALLDNININNEWNISVINDTDITKMMKTNISTQMKKCDQDAENGYSLTFRRNRNDKNLKPSVYMKSKKKTND